MPLVSLADPRCLAAYKIMKGRSQPPPDGTYLYSDELFPHIQSNPTLMSYSVVNKRADKHKHKRVQTDSQWEPCAHPGPPRKKHTQTRRRTHTHAHTQPGWHGALDIGKQYLNSCCAAVFAVSFSFYLVLFGGQ